jgi:hypothetical protein
MARRFRNGFVGPIKADATNWSTGLAGIDDLVDTEDFILSLLILGPWLIAYRETTIMRCSYLGLPNQTVFWEYMIYGEGAVSQNAVAELGGRASCRRQSRGLQIQGWI